MFGFFKTLLRLPCLIAALGLALVGFSQSATAGWVIVESDNFLIISNTGKSTTVDFVEELENYRHHVAAFTGVGNIYEALKCKIYLVKSDRQYEAITGSKDSAGMFRDADAGPVAIAQAGNKTLGMHYLRHEYVHHLEFMGQPVHYPLWYREGMAEFLAASKLDWKSFDFGDLIQGRYYDLTDGSKWYSMRDLLEARSLGNASREKLAVFYAQAWLFTHMLFLEPDLRERTPDFLEMLRKNVPPRIAVEKALGTNYDALQARLYGYFNRGKYHRWTLPRDRDFKPTIQTTKADAKTAQLIELQLGLDFPNGEGGYDGLLERVEQASAKIGYSPSLELIRARAYAGAKKYDEAIQVARDLMARSPRNRQAIDLLASLLIDSASARADEAGQTSIDLSILKEAIELEYATLDIMASEDTGIYPRLARAINIHPDYPGTDTEQFALRGLQNYPQSRYARNVYGYFLHTEGRYREACAYLQPLYVGATSKEEAASLAMILRDDAYRDLCQVR